MTKEVLETLIKTVQSVKELKFLCVKAITVK